MLHGVNVVAEAVKATLGPRGRNVLLQRPFGPPRTTKDGVAVARQIVLADRFENMGAQLVIEVASRTSEVVGDGTSTATVLAQAIAREGVKALAAGMNPIDLKRGIDIAVATLVNVLRERSQPISTFDRVTQIGTISANGDETIGCLLADAMERVGKDGVIVVEETAALETELEVIKGLGFDRGYLSSYFINDPRKMSCSLEEPFIFLYGSKVAAMQPIVPLLEAAIQARRPLLIIAEHVEGQALAALVINKRRGRLKVAAVKAPGFADSREAIMQDIAILTGAKVVSEEVGENLRGVTPEVLGHARRVTVTKDKTTIIGGYGDKSEIEARCRQIRALIEAASPGYDREVLRERLGKLAGGVAIVRVGGATEAEVKERRDRVENAVNSTRAAVEEGILPGGGVALFRGATALSTLKAVNRDQQAGIDIVRRAAGVPLRQIAENAGSDGSIVLGKLIERSDLDWGYDAARGDYCDLLGRGIVDPTKVIRTALETAASVAGLMIMTEAMVAERPESVESVKKPADGHGHSHGMEEMF